MRNSIILFVLFFISCSTSVIVEKDGNNSFESALSVTLPAYIEAKSDNKKDYFSFSIKEHAFIRLETSTVASLAIYKDKNLVKKFPQISSQNKREFNLSLERGKYYIEIESFESENAPYFLNIQKKTYDSKTEYEVNDSMQDAQNIVLPALINGNYSPNENKNEIDYFIASYESADNTMLILSCEVSAVPGIDCVLEILNEDGRVLCFSDYGKRGEAEISSEVIFPPSSKRYIKLYSKDSSQSVFPYQLRIKKSSADSMTEYEPNNIESEAVLLLEGTTEGNLYSKDDIDIFYFKLDSKQLLSLSIFSDSPQTGFSLANILSEEIKLSQANGFPVTCELDEGKYYVYVSGENVSPKNYKYSLRFSLSEKIINQNTSSKDE